jgi:hypothetical protein
MLTLIERGYSSDSKHHRAQLYLATYALLGLTFLATVAKSGTSTDFFVPLFVCSLLTGALALVLRTNWFTELPFDRKPEQRRETQPQAPRQQRGDDYPNAERLDRIASLRGDRYANRSLTSLAAAFPEFEQKGGNGGSQPAKEAPKTSARPRDPFSSALTDFDNRKKL